MNPTLIILAAGIGSRFGGLKQVEPLGPNGEFIIDYSIYDAINAGFGKVVIVIKKDMESRFEELFSSRFRNSVETEFVFQDLDNLVPSVGSQNSRKKPWGTGHAILACRNSIKEPFCVINADDFYGASSYKTLYSYLKKIWLDNHCKSGTNGKISCGLVGYELKNTLSRHGSVARGICDVDSEGYLSRLVERTKITMKDSAVVFQSSENSWSPLRGDELVSVNLWGFVPEIFNHLSRQFETFLSKHSADENSEFFITTAIDELISEAQAKVSVLTSTEKWFGVTHSKDKSTVKEQILERIKAGDYPEKLWG